MQRKSAIRILGLGSRGLEGREYQDGNRAEIAALQEGENQNNLSVVKGS
jgi:hypothetical protein